MLLATHSRCSLEDAEAVLLLEKFQGKHTSYHVKKIKIVSAQDVWYLLYYYLHSFIYCHYMYISITASSAYRISGTTRLHA
jgi:hypothetical protein